MAWLRRLLRQWYQPERAFPAREPRWRVHFEGRKTTAELLRALQGKKAR